MEPPADQPIADSDGDGVNDAEDLCPETPNDSTVDETGCPADVPVAQPTPDSDGDGVPDDADLCPDTPMATAIVDVDGCVAAEGTGQATPPTFPLFNLCGNGSEVAALVLVIGWINLRSARSGARRSKPHAGG